MLYLFILLLIFSTVQLVFWIHSFVFLSENKPLDRDVRIINSSIVIVFKNEINNLKKNIPLILNQINIEFELVLVNDNSNDGSYEWLLSLQDHRIKLLNLEVDSGKKKGLDLALENINSNKVLLTDADCTPISPEWAYSMLSSINGSKSIILGYSKFYHQNGFLNLIQRVENFLNGVQYLSFAKSGMAYMATGRNLAYDTKIRKQVNFANNYYSIKSGDDDLLVNAIDNKNQIGIQISKDSQTISAASSSWTEYYYQKRRHLQAGIYYKIFDRIILALIGSSQLLFNILIVILFLFDFKTTFLISLFVCKSAIQTFFYYHFGKKLSEKGLWLWVWILEPLYLIIISTIGISIWIKKVDRWK